MKRRSESCSQRQMRATLNFFGKVRILLKGLETIPQTNKVDGSTTPLPAKLKKLLEHDF